MEWSATALVCAAHYRQKLLVEEFHSRFHCLTDSYSSVMKNISAAMLPQIQLNDGAQQTLQKLAGRLEEELITQYETFTGEQDRQLDPKRWKHSRTDGDLMVFRERKSILHLEQEALARAKQHQRSQSRSSKTSTGDYPPQATLAAESLHPRVLLTGLQTGRLEDIMYGLTYQDTESFQEFWESQDNQMETSAVLAKIQGPTLEDPFRFMGVTWFLRTYPVPTQLLHQRDWVMLSDIKLTRLSNGERVGISILHSIQHRDLPELTEFGTVRATCSLVQLFRQHDPHRVEVFSLNLLDNKGHAMPHLNIFQAVNYVVPSACYANANGFNKKLRWLLSKQVRTRQLTRGTSCQVIEPRSSGDADHCEQCSKSLTRIFSSSGTTCELCYKRVCSKCSVTHHLPDTHASSKSKTLRVDLCVECAIQTKALSACTVAKEELIETCGSFPSKPKRLSPTDRNSIHVVYL